MHEGFPQQHKISVPDKNRFHVVTLRPLLVAQGDRGSTVVKVLCYTFHLVYNVTKDTYSAYMNDILHKSNKRREVNDISTPSLSL